MKNWRMVCIVLGGLIVLSAPYVALFQIYGPHGVMDRLQQGEKTRAYMKKRVEVTYATGCDTAKSVASAISEFAAGWLPPDQDYLRIHPHEDSAEARFHANRVFGLERLEYRMTVIQARACRETAVPATP